MHAIYKKYFLYFCIIIQIAISLNAPIMWQLPVGFSETCQTSTMELCQNTLLTVKSSILVVWQGSEYTSS